MVRIRAKHFGVLRAIGVLDTVRIPSTHAQFNRHPKPGPKGYMNTQKIPNPTQVSQGIQNGDISPAFQNFAGISKVLNKANALRRTSSHRDTQSRDTVFASQLLGMDVLPASRWMTHLILLAAFNAPKFQWKRDRWILPRGRRRTGRGSLYGQDPQR